MSPIAGKENQMKCTFLQDKDLFQITLSCQPQNMFSSYRSYTVHIPFRIVIPLVLIIPLTLLSLAEVELEMKDNHVILLIQIPSSL